MENAQSNRPLLNHVLAVIDPLIHGYADVATNSAPALRNRVEAAILTGVDQRFEAWLDELMPEGFAGVHDRRLRRRETIGDREIFLAKKAIEFVIAVQ